MKYSRAEREKIYGDTMRRVASSPAPKGWRNRIYQARVLALLLQEFANSKRANVW